MKVEDVMVREVRTASPETSLKDVAAVLAGQGISGASGRRRLAGTSWG
jgi:CBS domain-containing protein